MFKNIVANFIGRFWSILSNFLFIPLYIRFLGIESYSVISFSLVITGVMAILDAGLSATLSREFAIKANSISDKIKIFFTLEACYLIIAAIIIICTFTSTDYIANHWLNLNKLDPSSVAFYLKIMGIGIALRFLGDFYIGGLLGLEKQVKANVFQVSWGIVRNGLVLIPIIFWPTLEVFFIWQTASTLLYAFLLRLSLMEELTGKFFIFKRPNIEKSILEKVWKFAGGMMLISIVFGINTQMDKIAISKLLPIDKLGYYTLAVSLSQGLAMLANPISTAILPRLTSYYSENKINEVSLLFNKIFIIVSILLFSIASNIILNSEEILWIWTGNHKLASNSYEFVPYLIFGMTMASLQTVLYSIAIANGYTKLNNYLGIICVVLALPGYWIMTRYFGAIGAAITWCAIQTLVTPIYLHLIIKRFLPGLSTAKLLIFKIIIPAIIAGLVSYAFTFVKIFAANRFEQLLWIGLSTSITLIVSVYLLIDKDQYSFLFFWNKTKNLNHE